MKYRSKRAFEILSDDGPLKLVGRLFEYVIISYYVRTNAVRSDELGELADRIWYFDREDEISFSDRTNRGVPSEFTQYLSPYRPEQPFVCEIPSCYLVGPAAAGFSGNGRLILETVGGDIDNLISRYSNFFGDRAPRALFAAFDREIAQTAHQSHPHVFPLVSSYDRYYYHWITIYLTRLRTLAKYEQLTGNTPVVLVEPDPPSFVTETLELLGYGPDRVIEWQGGKQEINNLIVTNHRIQNGVIGLYQHSREDYVWLREKIRSAIDDRSSTTNGRKIFISRQEADAGRKVVNYDELMDVLATYGVEPVVLESMPIERQLEIIVTSDMIIGPHGAGLVNMLFANDPTVIELLPEAATKPTFYMISDVMGFEYRCLVCESRARDDIVVDVDEVAAVLDEYVT